MVIALDDLILQRINLWLEGDYDDETKSHIRFLLKENPQQLCEAFSSNLSFGTGGLRALVGIGTNRLNVYTIRAATQGLACYIQKHGNKGKIPAVCIGYDSRHYSRQFAEETAKVLAGNQIQVFLFKELRPTPLVSFGCRFKNCQAAVMITASHNPPSYNGYKVFWADGGQVVTPHDKGIILEMEQIVTPSMIQSVPTISHPLIHEVRFEVDNAYLDAIATLQHYPKVNHEQGSHLKIVYSSLHGTGGTIVPRALQAWGFSNVNYVESQMVPDGSFPTVQSPNPEEPEALEMGMHLMLKTNSDILIVTDPDADRMGLAVRHNNQAVLLNGNQISVLCLKHICEALKGADQLPSRGAFIKTIGTTELFQAICDSYERPCFNVLTGFKYIAAKIQEWEGDPNGYQYIFGGEESYGYLLGTFTREKDAVLSSSLISEVALKAKLEGKTLVDKLHDLYHQYGIYHEELLVLNFDDTKEGKDQMHLNMAFLRNSKLGDINGVSVVAIEDYLLSTRFDLKCNCQEPITLPVSDVLLYWLEDGSKVIIRPSGTEPKVKIYCGVMEKNFSSLLEGMNQSRRRSRQILLYFKELLMCK